MQILVAPRRMDAKPNVNQRQGVCVEDQVLKSTLAVRTSFPCCGWGPLTVQAHMHVPCSMFHIVGSLLAKAPVGVRDGFGSIWLARLTSDQPTAIRPQSADANWMQGLGPAPGL
jgi:hypothetical protein